MSINYLLSGIDKNLGFYKEQKEYLKKDINNNSIITFISSSFDDIEKSNKYYNLMLDWFNKIDINFKESFLINNEVTKEEAKNMIDKSNVIFIMGGDTLKQIKSINEYDIIPNINTNDKVVIGVSAGSINMANNVVLAKDLEDNIPNHSFYKGIGIVDINIEPHFDFNNLKHNKDIIEISKENKIICLPDESFIRIENDNTEIVGDYYIYDKEGNLHKNHEVEYGIRSKILFF